MTETRGDPRPLRALLVEDSRLDAELLRVQLERLYPAIALEVTHDEQAFLAALARGGWDLLLSDYELAGFTGADALEHRNRIAPHTPFVFVSGVIGEDNAVELLKRGATDYVSKARLERLGPVLRRALREADDRLGRETAERQLRHADITFARIVDSMRDYAVILLDDAGRVQFWNRAAGTIFGYASEEIVGRSAALIYGPDGEAALQAELREARERGKAGDNRWMVSRDGRRLWAEGAVTALQDENGRAGGFCKLVHDASGVRSSCDSTARKRSLAWLARSASSLARRSASASR